ncbi:hypothetical protein EYF80_042684 [Liparis tanakae]|uniref:Uncharacterized protein n=1 Tax=Liparis tanakae TaxID=230148 RepID=A0A4Z2G0M5_9TELE|nr:hypothetical protein EYF80_042684 [Liparis tanakae]
MRTESSSNTPTGGPSLEQRSGRTSGPGPSPAPGRGRRRLGAPEAGEPVTSHPTLRPQRAVCKHALTPCGWERTADSAFHLHGEKVLEEEEEEEEEEENR